MQGHIHKRVRTCKNGRKSTLWYVVVDLPQGANGERRQKWHGGFQTKKAAEAVRARLVHELTTGFYVEPSRMLLSEWLVDHWLPVHKTRVKKTTYRAYRSAIVHHINPRIGGVAIGKLKPQMLNNLYQQLLADGRCDGEGGLAPATVSGIHVVLRKALADAEDGGLIPRNPAIRAKPPRPKSQGGELRFWTPAELREFLALVEGHRLEAAFHLLAMTGARRGEGRRVAVGRRRRRHGSDHHPSDVAGRRRRGLRVEGNGVQPSGLDLWYTPLMGMALGELRFAAWRAAGELGGTGGDVLQFVLDPLGTTERWAGAPC